MSVEFEGVSDGWDISPDFLGGDQYFEKTETTWIGREISIQSIGSREDEIFKKQQIELALVQDLLQKNEIANALYDRVEYPLPFEELFSDLEGEIILAPAWGIDPNQQFMLAPANMQNQMGRCGRKKFWKKHKKAIIITAVVVVVVVGTVIAVTVLSPSAASTVAGVGGSAIAGLASSDSSPTSPPPASTNRSPPPSSGGGPTHVLPPPPSFGNFESPKTFYDNPIAPLPPVDFHSMLPSSQFPSPGFQPFPSPISFSESKVPLISQPNFSPLPSLQQESPNHLGANISTPLSDMTKFWETKTPSFSDPLPIIPNTVSSSNIFSDTLTPLSKPFSTENTLIGSKEAVLSPLGHQSSNYFSQEIQNIALQNNFSVPSGINNHALFQWKGETPQFFGYQHQTIHDLNKAIEGNPNDPMLYLQRSASYFDSGQYDQSFEDFHQFVTQKENAPEKVPFSTAEFTCGFVRGLPKGVYESGKGILLFLGDAVTHPIHTANQMYNGLSTLAQLARTDEWGLIAEALSPEIYQLVTQWDSLPSDQRGELAGYALGKHGGDILAPGVAAKIASKATKSAQELAAVLKNLQMTDQTLILETAAGMGNAAKVGEIVNASKRIEFLSEELGFASPQVSQLKQAGILEVTLQQEVNHLPLSMQESVVLHKGAREFLEPYKGFMPEAQVRELIHQTGIPTFQRPAGIPENFRIKVSDKGAGMIYMHPEHAHTSVRIMPGKPHSPFPHQQKPYAVQMKDGVFLDKSGNVVLRDSVEAHIPLEEFVFLGD